ncbi:sodium- and chloride-dependent GABA transporter 2-like isoform X2 [Ostrea edulis]|uniref:sodium- and chloride-dependent GABA transporter 2-like isoform X2 n=1 Tax=Ostrea edulis TaxID=37623 RepID=UPI0024AF14FA|nr:sodium- and chloride-dependent GABA transporter 2-like isoform X2 [Ostrea edulis]XP_056002145.1 sodium- and chloride-dependent GABA transporter 2-like isoform X2 [Ostrea edulis]XP_056002147.1 sodium- and chloride-dependent GABA transporter 2-like isoform X2 [Ostrea edulis]XP_056002148.1 sodium- and chloride-dependent GABA transporter 2-like isoform X2 [Ostrea edulis]
MGENFAQWNLLQLSFIAVFPAYLAYIRIVNGMALVSLYVYLFVLCMPAMLIQMKLGGYNQKGLVGLLSRHLPISKGVGVALLVDLFLTCLYVAPLVCHFGMYAIISMIEQPYVWSSCDNEWNSENCVDIHKKEVAGVASESTYTFNGVDQKTRVTPELDFYHEAYLQLTDSVSNVTGFPIWTFTSQLQNVGISLLPVVLAILWILVFLFTAFGARVAGWILFVLGGTFVGMLLAVLGYGYNSLSSEYSNNFLMNFYNLDFKGFLQPVDTRVLINTVNEGFDLLMNSLPVWTAIPVTMGKFTGKGKITRNLGWLLVIVTYALVIQIPQLAMAPYIGNLLEKSKSSDIFREDALNGIQLVFNVMPAAFAELEIPPEYAMLFYLSLFICGFMFLCVAMLTIVDNIVDSLTSRFTRLFDRKHCCTFVTTFFLMVALMCLGLLMTTRAGFYYIILLDQSITRLRFITVFILAVSVIIVYVKHTFSIVERILISIWCILAATATAGFWLYSFIMYLGQPLRYAGHEYSKVFDLVSWIISAVPYIAIPAAAMHSCGLYEGSCKERMKYMFCGNQDETRDYQGYYPAPEPSAPPAYSYNSNSFGRNGSMLYPLEDTHKNMYDPELEPLDTRLRSSRI